MNQSHDVDADLFVEEFAIRKGRKRDRLSRSEKARDKRSHGRKAKEERIYGR